MIISRPATSEYLEGYDRIFGKKMEECVSITANRFGVILESRHGRISFGKLPDESREEITQTC